MNENNYNDPNKSLAFIGFMGVGKTTIAKLMAAKLNRPFIDIDQKIEAHFQKPTTKIFAEYGEDCFREQEKKFILDYCKQPNKIISLGGGAFLQDAIKDACLKHSLVIYLAISWEAWKERIPSLINSRPILQNKSIDEIKDLFDERQSIYQEHHLAIQTDHKTPEEITNELILHLKKFN